MTEPRYPRCRPVTISMEPEDVLQRVRSFDRDPQCYLNKAQLRADLDAIKKDGDTEHATNQDH